MAKKASILIVDDIVDNLKLLNEILSTSGFNVRPADNGQLAVSSAVAEKPDMILLDVRMPEMDGFEVCRLLKANLSTADIPVIFISAYDELSDRLKGFELGAVDFITKPFEPREVIARINTQLELSHLRRESIRQATELLNSNLLLQDKNEEIAAQNEELRLQNEEMQMSNKIIEKNEERFRSYVENAPHSILIMNPLGYFLDVNNQAVKTLGYSQAELLKMNAANLLSEDDHPKIKESIDQLNKIGRYESEVKIICKNGTLLYCELNAIKIDDNSYLGFVKDISDRKSVETAMERRLAALTKPLDNDEGINFDDMFNPGVLQRIQDEFSAATGVASIITATDGSPITKPSNFTRLCSEIIRCTQKGLDNCYYSDSIIGRYNSEGPVVQHCLSGGLWDAGASITVGDRHIANWLIGQVRDESQTEESIRSYAKAIGADENEAAIAFMEVPAMSFSRFEQIAKALYTLTTQLSTTAYQNIQQARYITERKKAEEEKNKLQEQLNQSQKMESVGRLAGGVAHDFNNMLSVILGQAQLALMDIEDSNPLKHTLEQITVAAKRSADLTRQLLAFARKQIITPKIIDVNDTVEGILKLLKRLIGEDISLLWIPSPQALNVKMDPVQVDQLLTNMLVNSRDAISGEGEITVSAAFTVIDQIFCELNPGAVAGDYVLLQVSDNGCGMTTETIENIFEPFYTTKEIGKGTGLGMATVYGIIKQNQGFITVHSEVGIGSTFKIYLPCYTITSSGAEVKGRSEKAVGGNETILVVEDENAVLEITKDMLESLGYQVMTYTEPQKAVEFIRSYSGKLDLLISDVIMPAMNGRDLANNFKAVRSDLKTLFMSGYTAENIDRHGMLDEGVCFLQKPFSRKELADKVREAIKK